MWCTVYKVKKNLKKKEQRGRTEVPPAQAIEKADEVPVRRLQGGGYA
jgi:hypothetical protein